MIRIRGMGHCPSFKNKKRTGRNGRPYTDKKTKAWMKHVTDVIASTLHCFTQINGDATWTELCRQSWTALLPPDDNRKVIPSIILSATEVPKGEEGADILIERI